MINRSALNLSHAVDDEAQALFPLGAKIGTCSVSQVVVNVVDAVCRVAIQVARDLVENGFTRVDILVESGGNRVGKKSRAVWGGIKKMYDFYHHALCDAPIF